MSAAPPFFFYGSLRYAPLRDAVLGEPAPVTPARAAGWRVVAAGSDGFPALWPAGAGELVPGVLAAGLSDRAIARLRAFEADDYDLVDIDVLVDEAGGVPRRARLFQPSAAARGQLARAEAEGRLAPWRYDAWLAADAERSVGLVGLWLGLVEQDGTAAADRIWPDLVGAAEAGAARLGTGYGREAVSEQALERQYQGMRSVDRFTGRVRRFDGAMSAPFENTIIRANDAVAVIAYDPTRDAVLLIEQWRVGAWVSGDPRPWLIELPAGAVDPGESAEAAARRETLEETGVDLGAMERICETYPAPALADEVITLFVARADLGALMTADRIGGVASEVENIRAFAVDRQAALQAAARGEIRSGFTLLALNWLDRHHRRLALVWR